MTKPTKWPVRPVKTQISLGFHPVWSESSLTTWRNHGSLATHWAHSKDSDQTRRMPRLIWVFAGHTHFIFFVNWQLNSWKSGYSCNILHKLPDIGINLQLNVLYSYSWDTVVKWATSWQNQQNDCALSKDSDQPWHPPSLIRVFAVRLMGS